MARCGDQVDVISKQCISLSLEQAESPELNEAFEADDEAEAAWMAYWAPVKRPEDHTPTLPGWVLQDEPPVDCAPVQTGLRV